MALSHDAKELLSRLFTVHPADRMTIGELLCHTWVMGSADDTGLGEVYSHRVKALALRQKLRRVFADGDGQMYGQQHGQQHGQKRNHECFVAPAIPPGQERDRGDSMDEVDLGCVGLDWCSSTAAEQYFVMFDIDQDGFLSRQELRYGITSLMYNNRTEAECNKTDTEAVTAAVTAKICPGVDVDIDEVFSIIDTRGDGKIDREEFRAFFDVVILPSTMR